MKAIYNISYGVFVLTVKEGEKKNGCIINTLMQVTSTPNQVSITVNKDNLTTEILKNTGAFNVSIIDKTATFDLIKRFGFASGKTTDKFGNFNGFKEANNGIPYITEGCNSYVSCKVVKTIDVGTHLTFVAEVLDDVVLNENKPLTYAEYLSDVKPKPQTTTKTSYVCKICGYVYEGEELPKDFVCPICKHGVEDFERK